MIDSEFQKEVCLARSTLEKPEGRGKWDIEYALSSLHQLATMAEIHYDDPETSKELLEETARYALKLENPTKAVLIFKELGDFENLRKAGEMALRKNSPNDALAAFEPLQDESALEKVACALVQEKDEFNAERALLAKTEFRKKLWDVYHDFQRRYGFENIPSQNFVKTINASETLAPNYDLGVGIAKGGLFASYIFETSGLPIIMSQTHRRGKGATFKWHDNPEPIKGKRILVLDKDVVSGRSLRRALREIKSYSPESLDVFLNIDPNTAPVSIRSITENVPEGYGKIHFPAEISYDGFSDRLRSFKEKLGAR